MRPGDQDLALAAAVLHERTKVYRIPEGKEALRRVVLWIEEVRREQLSKDPAARHFGATEPATLKTEWTAPGRGETVWEVLSLFPESRKDLGEHLSGSQVARSTRTSLRFTRPGPPLAYDLERGREALRRVGFEVS